MAYLLDADVFIRAKNDHYGFNFCPAFWDWLNKANVAGDVYSVEAVYTELMKGGDHLSRWSQAHKQLFLVPSSSVWESVHLVNQWVQTSHNYEPEAKDEFALKADSVLIGHALAGGHTVVTHERSGKGRKKIKIPDAADALGVSCVDPFQMLRTLGPRFVLDRSKPVAQGAVNA